MTDRRDPKVMALIVELAESSRSAPSYAELEETSVEPLGLKPVRPLRMSQLAVQRRRWVVALAAAAVVLLAVGGVAWLLRSGVEDSPVVTQVPPSTTAVTSDSSALGELRWTSFQYVSIEESFGRFVATDAGFAATSQTQLWTSADGISWTPGSLPFDPSGEVSFLEKDVTGRYWLFEIAPGNTPLGLWRSDDAVSWSQVDMSAIRAPSLSGVEWWLFPQSLVGAADWTGRSIVSNGDTTLAWWRISGFVPWHEILSVDEFLDTAWDPQSQILELIEAEPGEPVLARLSLSVVSEDPLTIEATDVETGALVHTFIGSVEGFSTEELLAGLAYGFDIGVLSASDDGNTFETVPTPWTLNEGGFSGEVERYTRIVASGGRFYAYSLEVFFDFEAGKPPSGTVETWISSDGRTWTSAGTPTFAEGQDVTAVTAVLERDGVFLVGVWLQSGQTLWRSENGIDWTPVVEGGPVTDGGQAHRGDFGWVFTTELPGLLAIWVSHDGKNWQRVDIDSAEGLAEPAAGYFVDVAGDTIFVLKSFVDTDPAQARTMWVGTFDG